MCFPTATRKGHVDVSPTRYTFWKQLYYELAKASISKGTLLRGTEVRREECPHRIKVLSSFPKQKNKQYSTANIQRTAHHVCLSCNNKSWDTAIAPGWLRTKPTLVLIKFGGLHTGLVTKGIISTGSNFTENWTSGEPEPVVNVTSRTALAMSCPNILYCTCLRNKQIFCCHSCEPRTKFNFFK